MYILKFYYSTTNVKHFPFNDFGQLYFLILASANKEWETSEQVTFNQSTFNMTLHNKHGTMTEEVTQGAQLLRT